MSVEWFLFNLNGLHLLPTCLALGTGIIDS